jgi:two-component system copper resistance phosphate regulon response regulator CusR
VLDTGSRAAYRAGSPISLTPLEFVLLELLMRNTGRVVPRDDIAEAVWGSRTEVEPNNIDVLVRTLRARVDDPHVEKLIHTVRGAGYKLAASRSLA